jgi:hypothetical protein
MHLSGKIPEENKQIGGWIMTEVVAALIWNKDKFMICQCPAQKSAAFCGYSYFLLVRFSKFRFAGSL